MILCPFLCMEVYMDIPKIRVKGKEIELPRPTMKMWRRVAEYDEQDKEGWGTFRLMDEHSKVLAEMYGLPSPDDIDPADVLVGYTEAATYVLGIAGERLKELPKNVEAETEK